MPAITKLPAYINLPPSLPMRLVFSTVSIVEIKPDTPYLIVVLTTMPFIVTIIVIVNCYFKSCSRNFANGWTEILLFQQIIAKDGSASEDTISFNACMIVSKLTDGVIGACACCSSSFLTATAFFMRRKEPYTKKAAQHAH